MASAISKNAVIIERCALCKIDLKGRFAYLDEEFMSLTGYSDEELLGKSISKILDADSGELIRSLVTDRNHYDTFFDSVKLTLITKQNRKLSLCAVVSLNFIGGNPVNLQMILTKASSSGRSEVYAGPDQASLDFLLNLSEIDDFNNLNELLQSMLGFAGAGQLGIYDYDKSTISLKISVNDENNAKYTNSEMPATSIVHLMVADSGNKYSYTDDKAVQKAIEKSGSAPQEFVTSFITNSNNQYVLRFIYDDKIEGKEAVAAVSKAAIGSKILQKLIDLIGNID
ncbi:MAG: PAS domain S-box protein [candidate division Zixibacteria bacterium]|nr:PAS domain S-box protein [candidate division Zixibacteria bacterium]